AEETALAVQRCDEPRQRRLPASGVEGGLVDRADELRERLELEFLAGHGAPLRRAPYRAAGSRIPSQIGGSPGRPGRAGTRSRRRPRRTRAWRAETRSFRVVLTMDWAGPDTKSAGRG